MNRLALILVAMSIAACGPTETKQQGTITNIAKDAQTARTQAQDAVAAAQAAARRVETQTQQASKGQ
jgi:hypothetical protein